MLTLNRKIGQRIIIKTKSGEKIIMQVNGVANNPSHGYSFSFEANNDVKIHREEQYNHLVKIGKIKDKSVIFNENIIDYEELDAKFNGNK